MKRGNRKGREGKAREAYKWRCDLFASDSNCLPPSQPLWTLPLQPLDKINSFFHKLFCVIFCHNSEKVTNILCAYISYIKGVLIILMLHYFLLFISSPSQQTTSSFQQEVPLILSHSLSFSLSPLSISVCLIRAAYMNMGIGLFTWVRARSLKNIVFPPSTTNNCLKIFREGQGLISPAFTSNLS